MEKKKTRFAQRAMTSQKPNETQRATVSEKTRGNQRAITLSKPGKCSVPERSRKPHGPSVPTHLSNPLKPSVLLLSLMVGCAPTRTPIVIEPQRAKCLHGPGTVETLPGTRLVITTVPVSLPDEPECVPYDMDDDQDVDLRDWAKRMNDQ